MFGNVLRPWNNISYCTRLVSKSEVQMTIHGELRHSEGEASDQQIQEMPEKMCTLRVPTYQPGLLFEKAWMACVDDGKDFVFDAERMLLAIESMIGTSNRSHHFFLDLKQFLFLAWPVPAFIVSDCDYPDTVGAIYHPPDRNKASYDKWEGMDCVSQRLRLLYTYMSCALQQRKCIGTSTRLSGQSSAWCKYLCWYV